MKTCEENGGLFEVGGGFYAKLQMAARRGQDVASLAATSPPTYIKGNQWGM